MVIAYRNLRDNKNNTDSTLITRANGYSLATSYKMICYKVLALTTVKQFIKKGGTCSVISRVGMGFHSEN